MHLDIRKATVGHKAGWAIWDVHADRAHARTLFKTKKAALEEAQAMLDAEREVERCEAEARAEVEATRAQKAAARVARLAQRAAIQLDRSRQMELFCGVERGAKKLNQVDFHHKNLCAHSVNCG